MIMKRITKIILPITIITIILILLGYCYFRFNMQFIFAYGKGGFGIADKDVYVTTIGERNQIQWGAYPNSLIWEGSPKEQIEVVMFDGSNVIPYQWSKLRNRPLIFRFTPERIYIYDLKKISGGYYLRSNGKNISNTNKKTNKTS